MRQLLLSLALIALAIAAIALLNRQPNNGLPLVQIAVPKHGFVCTPAITPRLGPVSKQEIV